VSHVSTFQARERRRPQRHQRHTLVDVCLVLLVIFMVVTPMIQAGVKVDLPKTAKAPAMPGQQNELAVTIRQDGSLWSAASKPRTAISATSSPRSTRPSRIAR